MRLVRLAAVTMALALHPALSDGPAHAADAPVVKAPVRTVITETAPVSTCLGCRKHRPRCGVSCYSLYGGYGPWGGASYWSEYTAYVFR